ncbi:hypothetical protein Tco_0736224 [Tanacetum coccineum]
MAVGVDVRRDEDDGDGAVVTKRERDGGKGVMGSVREEGDESGGVVACASTAGGGGRRGALARKNFRWPENAMKAPEYFSGVCVGLG